MRRILSLVLGASLILGSCTRGDLLPAREAPPELTVSISSTSYNQRVTLTIDLVAAVKTYIVVVPAGQTVVRIQTNEPNACCPRILKIEKE